MQDREHTSGTSARQQHGATNSGKRRARHGEEHENSQAGSDRRYALIQVRPSGCLAAWNAYGKSQKDFLAEYEVSEFLNDTRHNTMFCLLPSQRHDVDPSSIGSNAISVALVSHDPTRMDPARLTFLHTRQRWRLRGCASILLSKYISEILLPTCSPPCDLVVPHGLGASFAVRIGLRAVEDDSKRSYTRYRCTSSSSDPGQCSHADDPLWDVEDDHSECSYSDLFEPRWEDSDNSDGCNEENSGLETTLDSEARLALWTRLDVELSRFDCSWDDTHKEILGTRRTYEISDELGSLLNEYTTLRTRFLVKTPDMILEYRKSRYSQQLYCTTIPVSR